MGRPVPRFQEFVGQRRIVAILQPQLEGAKARGEPFPPALLCGPSGIGKSLLAQACAQAYGTTLCSVDGHEPVARIVERFKTLKTNDFVFIDEAHNLANGAQELLYSCIDHRRIPPWALPAKDIKDLQLSTEGFPIAPFSLLLATDQPGQLLGALRRRLELTLSLEYYSNKEMRAIVDHQATGAELLLSPQARNKVARVACGLPRRAKHLLQNLRRHFPDAEQRQLTLDDTLSSTSHGPHTQRLPPPQRLASCGGHQSRRQ